MEFDANGAYIPVFCYSFRRAVARDAAVHGDLQEGGVLPVAVRPGGVALGNHLHQPEAQRAGAGHRQQDGGDHSLRPGESYVFFTLWSYIYTHNISNQLR